MPDILEPDELLGKSWYGEVSIKGAFDLPLMVDVAYCQYEFWQDDEPVMLEHTSHSNNKSTAAAPTDKRPTPLDLRSVDHFDGETGERCCSS